METSLIHWFSTPVLQHLGVGQESQDSMRISHVGGKDPPVPEPSAAVSQGAD